MPRQNASGWGRSSTRAASRVGRREAVVAESGTASIRRCLGRVSVLSRPSRLNPSAATIAASTLAPRAITSSSGSVGSRNPAVPQNRTLWYVAAVSPRARVAAA